MQLVRRNISFYFNLSYISPNVILFWWTTGLWVAILWLLFPFFSIPLGASVFLSTDGIFMVTRLANALPNELKSFVDLAKCLLRLLLTDMRTDPFFCDLIWGIFSRFSLNKDGLNERKCGGNLFTYHRFRSLF